MKYFPHLTSFTYKYITTVKDRNHLFAITRFVKNKSTLQMSFLSVTTLLGITSLGLYLVENNEASIFYYLPFRLYEFCAGSLIFLILKKRGITIGKISNLKTTILFFAYLSVLLLLFANNIDCDSFSTSLPLCGKTK